MRKLISLSLASVTHSTSSSFSPEEVSTSVSSPVLVEKKKRCYYAGSELLSRSK